MGSSYPGTLDAFAINKGRGDLIRSSERNDLADAVNKIEAELGTTPSSSYPTLTDRLTGLSRESIVVVQGSSIGSQPFDIQVNTGHADGLRMRFRIENNPASQLVDIDVRGAILNVGSDDPAQSAPGTQAIFFAPSGDTSSAIQVKLPGQGSSGTTAVLIGRTGLIQAFPYGQSSTWFLLGSASEGNPRFTISESPQPGALHWGPGSAGVDTNLYRSTVGRLTTDGQLQIGLSLFLGSFTIATRPSAGLGAGQLIYVSDAAAGNKLQYSDGSSWVVAG